MSFFVYVLVRCVIAFASVFRRNNKKKNGFLPEMTLLYTESSPGKLPTRCTVRKLGTQTTRQKTAQETTQRRKYARYCRNVDQVTGRNKAWLQLPSMIRHTWYELCRERETDLSPVPPLSSSPVSKRRQQLSKGGLNLELEEKRAKMPIPARKQRGKKTHFQKTTCH